MQVSVRSQFGKHVPRILRRQLVLQLTEQYLNADHSDESMTSNECKPSIQRFYGALLFIDISGFTVLSQQLSPEDLKYYINEYFTKMLDIVDKHGGDVIKFAGDALFVIWETNQMIKLAEQDSTSEDGEPFDGPIDFHTACRLAVSIAVECGLEINQACSNHRVSLIPRNKHHDKSNLKEDNCAYLNVHSGVTIGLMAGIDIGCNDRWEYFLMGEPLSSVAIAEAQASTGEIVVCPETHTLLHPSMRPVFLRAVAKLKICNAFRSKFHTTTNQTNRPAYSVGPAASFEAIQELKQTAHLAETIPLYCGCLKTPNGYCKVTRGGSSSFSSRFKRSLQQKEKQPEQLVEDGSNAEIESVFDTFIGRRLSEMTSVEDLKNEFLRGLASSVTLNVAPVPLAMTSAALAALNIKSIADRVKLEFVKWAHSCLVDDIARHVHDVVRSTYRFEDTSRVAVCRREITKQLATLNSASAVQKAKDKFHAKILNNRKEAQPQTLEKTMSILDGTKKVLSQHKLQRFVRAVASARSTINLLDQKAAGYTAELRSVTVMFVKIDMSHMDLTVENLDFGEHVGHFGFLTKTVNESLADVLLLHRLQSCMEALSDSFYAHGGQMRQFIVDDKGTVCIGTFGLRGAVIEDNAAAALETAHMIVTKLQSLGLNCSIGVTLGRNYCGLVGSENRHEYSVMGPSTNLSARLMCKAPPGGIICDREIRNQDRAHQFLALADIIAKGYKDPVGTFKPVFDDEAATTRARMKLSKQFSIIELPEALQVFRGKGQASFASGDMNSPTLAGTALKISPTLRLNTRVSPAQRMGPRRASVGGTEIETVNEDEADSSKFDGGSDGVQQSWLIRKMCVGPFYGSSGSDGDVHGELIGRDQEVRDVLQFLFCTLISQEGKIVSLKTDQPAVFAGILGQQGIGKSSVMYAVNHKVTSVVMVNRLKLQSFKTRINGFQAVAPFHPWKCVIKEILMRLYHLCKTKRSSTGGRRRSSVNFSVDMIQCVKNVVTLLPEDMRQYEPILGLLGIVPEQSDELRAMNLSRDELEDRTIELLFEIMKVYVEFTKNVVMFLCEDVQYFDLPSQLLLKHIWMYGTGMLCLFSAERSLNAASSHPRPDSEIGNALAAIENVEDVFADSFNVAPGASPLVESMPDFVSFMEDQERYLEVALELFSQERTNMIIKSTLASCGIAAADAVLLSKIYNESGGNPMYAYELAKSVAQMHKEQIDLTRVSVKFKNCHRLEEIICHRFDQLSTSAQSLLKIAAAICCHGSSFKYDMLVFVMMDEDHEESVDHLAEDLMDIVNSESFLKATCDQDDKDEDFRDFQEREIAAQGIKDNLYTFYFNISLEKKTIYELLLGDQKQVVHERIAEYYLRRRKEDPSATHHYHEESLHWQKASNWVHAMACSFYAALSAESEQKIQELIGTAYRMYQAMRQARHDLLIEEHGDWTLQSMRVLFDFSVSHADKLRSHEVCGQMSLDHISQMFNCDADLLRISLNLEVLMSRRRLLIPDQMMENQMKLEEALQILLLTKECDFQSSAKRKETAIEVDDEDAVSTSTSSESVEDFCVGAEFDSLFLKLVAVYLETYLLLTDREELASGSKKTQFMMRRFHVAATQAGVFHRIHSWSIDLRLNCKDGNFRQACVLGQKILDLYQYNKHSAEIIAFYGKDSVPCALAMISQYLFLSSEWRTSLHYHKVAVSFLEKMTHVDSLMGAVHFAVNNMVFLQHYEAAKKLFAHYAACSEANNREQSVGDGFYVEWLSRLVSYEEPLKEGRFLNGTSDQDAGVLDEFIKSEGEVHVIGHSHHNIAGLAVQGRGIDAVLAEVCALKIIVLWNSPDVEGGTKMDELRVYCRAFCGYVRETLQLSSGRPHELMFGKTGVLLTVLHLLQTVSRFAFEPSPPPSCHSGSGGNSGHGHSAHSFAHSNHSTHSLLSVSVTNQRELTVAVSVDKRAALLSELRHAVSDELMSSITEDCNHQYSVFTLLTLSLLSSVHSSLQESSDDEGVGLIGDGDYQRSTPGSTTASRLQSRRNSGDSCTWFEGNGGAVKTTKVGVDSEHNLKSPVEVSPAEANSVNVHIVEYRSRLHQLMLNGSCELKLTLLEKYKVSGLALLALPNSPHKL